MYLPTSPRRVIDLFREWDADGDGQITRKEFHTAMPRLGFDVSKVPWLSPLCRLPSYQPYVMPRPASTSPRFPSYHPCVGCLVITPM